MAHFLVRHDSFRPAVGGEKQQPPRTTLHWQEKKKYKSAHLLDVRCKMSVVMTFGKIVPVLRVLYKMIIEMTLENVYQY